MQSIVLKNKRPINIQGVRILDLHERSIDYSIYPNSQPLIIAAIEVTNTIEFRLDILSQLYYDSVHYVDLIAKFNGISNHFAVEEGDIIYIPELISMSKSLIDNNEQTYDNRLASVNGKNLNPQNIFADKFAKNNKKSL